VTDGELLDLLRLNLIPGIGPRTSQALLAHFRTAKAVLSASPSELNAVPGVGPKLSAAILESRRSDEAERELARCQEIGAKLLVRGTPAYPRRLEEIPDPPSILYYRGEFLPQDELAMAIVGSRHCTLYGRQQAERFAGGLARAGVTIISGLARGIDAAAHRGALAAGGRTIAVLATGVEKIYPPEHEELVQQILEERRGAILSETALSQQALRGVFPQRNRIISGLSIASIIVEASRTSGSLHTARHALEQGREVFALPGRIDSLASQGCHDLIRDGATLVRGIEDVLDSLGPLATPAPTANPEETVHSPRELLLNDHERRILNLVSVDPLHIDEIVRAAEIETPRVLQTLTILEMKRLLRRLPGGHYCRV
jgi:DNA processing protein